MAVGNYLVGCAAYYLGSPAAIRLNGILLIGVAVVFSLKGNDTPRCWREVRQRIQPDRFWAHAGIFPTCVLFVCPVR